MCRWDEWPRRWVTGGESASRSRDRYPGVRAARHARVVRPVARAVPVVRRSVVRVRRRVVTIIRVVRRDDPEPATHAPVEMPVEAMPLEAAVSLEAVVSLEATPDGST